MQSVSLLTLVPYLHICVRFLLYMECDSSISNADAETIFDNQNSVFISDPLTT